MKLNWKKLFEMQAALDRHIIEDKDLEGQDLIGKKILALQVELGELANELPEVFKFWSGKKKNNYEKALAEYIDCLHFILSIGISMNYHDMDLTANFEHDYQNENTVIEQFIELFQYISDFIDLCHFDEYTDLLTEFLILGEMLGFNADQVTQAYLDKNEINHTRQNTNY